MLWEVKLDFIIIIMDGHGTFNSLVYLNVEVGVLDFEVLVASKAALIFARLNAFVLNRLLLFLLCIATFLFHVVCLLMS